MRTDPYSIRPPQGVMEEKTFTDEATGGQWDLRFTLALNVGRTLKMQAEISKLTDDYFAKGALFPAAGKFVPEITSTLISICVNLEYCDDPVDPADKWDWVKWAVLSVTSPKTFIEIQDWWMDMTEKLSGTEKNLPGVVTEQPSELPLVTDNAIQS